MGKLTLVTEYCDDKTFCDGSHLEANDKKCYGHELERFVAFDGHAYVKVPGSPDMVGSHASDCRCITDPEGWY